MEETTITIRANVSAHARTRAWVEEGRTLPETVTWQVRVSELPPELRAYLAEAHGGRAPVGEHVLSTWIVVDGVDGGTIQPGAAWSVEPETDPVTALQADYERFRAAAARLRAEAAQWASAFLATAEALIADLDADIEPIPRAGKHRPSSRDVTTLSSWERQWMKACPEDIQTAVRTADERIIAAARRFEERRAARAAAARAAAEQRQADLRAAMVRWIADHGSETLRQSLAAGYPSVQRYLEERIAVEFPGFIQDSSAIDWRDCDSPSMAALELAAQYRGRVVVLTRWDGDPLPSDPLVEGVVTEAEWWDGLRLVARL
jgi:hypothetical protein